MVCLSVRTLEKMWQIVVKLIVILLPSVVQAQVCNKIWITNQASMRMEDVIGSVLEECHNMSSIRIELFSGEHFINSQTFFSEELKTIEFVGLENNVTVSCDYDVKFSINYTWYFDGLDSVSFSGIDFHHCPRPIRIDTVSNVTIKNCSFR